MCWCGLSFVVGKNVVIIELNKQRADKIDKMRSWIIEKNLWRKYDKTDQENGIKLAMTKRISKEEKTIRKRQSRESKR